MSLGKMSGEQLDAAIDDSARRGNAVGFAFMVIAGGIMASGIVDKNREHQDEVNKAISAVVDGSATGETGEWMRDYPGLGICEVADFKCKRAEVECDGVSGFDDASAGCRKIALKCREDVARCWDEVRRMKSTVGAKTF